MKSIKESNLGTRLIEFRLKYKKSQTFVQEKTGLSRPVITKIENGEGYVRSLTAFLINKMIEDYGGKENG